VATTNTGDLFSCNQLKNEPNTLAEVPPSVVFELLVPLNPFSTSSIQRHAIEPILAFGILLVVNTGGG
jgi:hypothetical protein